MPDKAIILTSCIENAWQKLQETNNINWLLMKFISDELQLITTGTHGYCEMVTQLDQKEIMFGILVVLAKDDCTSTQIDSTSNSASNNNANISIRRRYVFFTFTGSHVSPFQTAQQAIHAPQIQSLFSGISIRMEADSSLSAFTQKKIALQLLKSTGAHKPNRISFGPNDEHIIANLIA